MNYFPAFLCVVFCCGTVFGQSHVTDSLERQLTKVQGKEKVDLLNRLTWEYITNDNNKALEYGNKSIALSREIGYLNGEAWAYTYRGVLEYMTGDFPDGRQHLHRGLRLSQATKDDALRGYTLLQLGNLSLEEVYVDSAMIYFRESYKVYKDSTDPASLSKLYRNISALYGQRHMADSQRYYLDRAIAIRRLLPDKVLLSDALVLKANIILRMGDFVGAEEIIREAEIILKTQPGNKENLNDLRHLKAMVLFHRGSFEEATVLFDSARVYFYNASLLRKYVTLLIDLGKVFSDRGEYELALNNLYDGLRLSKIQGFEIETAIIRNEIGWINFHLGDMEQALSMADEAMSLGPARLLPGDCANMFTLKGVVLTEIHNYEPARVCLDSALAIYTRLHDNRGLSETLMNLGYLEGMRNNYSQALAYFQESVRLARLVPYPFGLAWSFWGMGDIYYKLGDYKNSDRCLDESEVYARLFGTSKILALNYESRSKLLAAQNRFREAYIYSGRASQLNDSIRRTDLSRRFLNLEKIYEIEQRDHDIGILQRDKLLAQDKIELQEAKLRQQSILLLTGVISLMLVGILALVYYRFYKRIKILNVAITEKNSRIQSQADKLKEVNLELERLYREVSDQKEKIQVQAIELTATNKNISDINRSLEKLVEEKTQQLRNTNEELVKHNSELLQFSYTVSHNLRGPVARLMSLSDLVLEENDLKEARQWLLHISNTALELDIIIKDISKILDLRNNPHQYHEKVLLANEWNQSRSLLEDSLTGEEEIIANFEALPEIVTVRPMLQSILYNLLSNAIKFRSPDRQLRVIATSRVEGGKAILEVTDNGLGFNTKLHGEKMFKLYKRFHTHVEGRGLGLYLIKSQVEVLHGTVEAESEPGVGSLFRITLPLQEVMYKEQA